MGRQRGKMEMIEPEDKKPSGCYITLTKGFLMLIMCMVVCIGIGIIVHFAEKNFCKQPEEQATSPPTQGKTRHNVSILFQMPSSVNYLLFFLISI